MARWKAHVEFLLSIIELLFLSFAVEALQGKMCQNSLPSGGGRSLGAKISGERHRLPATVLIPRERQFIALQLCRWQFLYNETLQQTFRSLLSKLSKRRQIWVLYPHFEEVRGGVEPSLMACLKERVEFLLRVFELLFLSLEVQALQGIMCKTRCLQAGVGHLEPRFQGEGVVPLPIYWYRSKGNWLRYNFAADSFYIMTLCNRLFVLYYRNCPKDDKFRYFIPILRNFRAA